MTSNEHESNESHDHQDEKAVSAHAAHDDHHDHDEPETDTTHDPMWWTPYAVLGSLVLIGLLGFFGLFNKVLEPIAAKVAREATPAHNTPHETKPAAPNNRPPAPSGRPQRPDQPAREMFGAKHLLVAYQGSQRAAPTITRTKEEAKTRATEALKKAKDGKTKFEDVVKEYTDEPRGGERGGDLGKFPKGAMTPAFQEAVEKTKVGEISDVVETPFGFHVLMRTQ